MHGKRCPSPKNHTSIDEIKFASPTAQAGCPNSPALPKDGQRIVLVAQCQLSENPPEDAGFQASRGPMTRSPLAQGRAHTVGRRLSEPPAAGAARIIAAASRLREHRIGDAPIAGHLPGLDSIEMSGADGFSRVTIGDAPVSVQFRPRWLKVA
jgi:hypothetical protein